MYTTIVTTGAITAQTNLNTAYPWFLQAIVSGTTAGGFLQGLQYGAVDNVAVAQTALTNVVTGLDFSGATSKVIGTVFGIVARVTFSVSETGNLAHLYQLTASAE